MRECWINVHTNYVSCPYPSYKTAYHFGIARHMLMNDKLLYRIHVRLK